MDVLSDLFLAGILVVPVLIVAGVSRWKRR